MNIQKLNPIGYTTTTPQGNTYKKSNIATSLLLATEVGTVGTVMLTKNPVIKSTLKQFTLMGLIEPLCKSIPAKHKTALSVASCIVDIILGGYVTGRIIDNEINKHRIKKADKQQEIK